MNSNPSLIRLVLSATMLLAPTELLRASPIITQVVETGGDGEETDTVTAKWTGETFVNGVAGEPISGTAADAPYTVGLFVEDAPMFVDRNHQWNGATAELPIPRYLLEGEYIMCGNDNRMNRPRSRLAADRSRFGASIGWRLTNELTDAEPMVATLE